MCLGLTKKLNNSHNFYKLTMKRINNNQTITKNKKGKTMLCLNCGLYSPFSYINYYFLNSEIESRHYR